MESGLVEGRTAEENRRPEPSFGRTVVLYDLNEARVRTISEFLRYKGHQHIVVDSAIECARKIREGCHLMLLGKFEDGVTAAEIYCMAEKKNVETVFFDIFDMPTHEGTIDRVKDYLQAVLSKHGCPALPCC